MAKEILGTTWTVYDADTLTQAEIYGQVLAELGGKHPEIVALTADLAKSTKIGKFQEVYPERFFNVGIAEQNMFGMAAGMAKSGLLPVVSTMAAFASMRAGEQVRTDICYQNLNVKIIATHAGLSFGAAGSTHHCLEDLSIMRAFPNMTVIVPADGIETAKAVRAAIEKHQGPVYIRIGRGFEPPYYKDENYGFEIGKAVKLREGTDISIIATGIGVLQAAEAADFLKENDGISVEVINMHTIKPIDREAVINAVKNSRRILTVEEHNVMGGLGSAVAEVIVESGMACAFDKIGIPDEFSIVGYPEDLYSHYKLDSNGIIEKVREIMGKDFEEDDNWDDEF
jgi:transketolase